MNLNNYNWKKIIFFVVISLGALLVFININDMLFGILMAFLLDNIVELMEDYGINKYLAILLTILFIFSAVFVIAFNLIPIIYQNLLSIIENFEHLLQSDNEEVFKINLFFKTVDITSWISNLVDYLKSLQWDQNHNSVNVGEIIKTSGLFLQKFSSLINIILGFSGTIFMARSLFNKMLLSIPNNYIHEVIEVRNKIKIFLFHQLVIAIFNGLFFTMIIHFFALKGAFSIGFIVALSSFFVISFGSLIGIVFSLIMMIVQQYNLLSIAIILGFLMVNYLVESYVLIPRLICDQLDINYLTLLIGILSVSKLLGFKYLLFTVPIIVIVKKTFKVLKY
jgi:predicted PurR-regulated permease PerM